MGVARSCSSAPDLNVKCYFAKVPSEEGLTLETPPLQPLYDRKSAFAHLFKKSNFGVTRSLSALLVEEKIELIQESWKYTTLIG